MTRETETKKKKFLLVFLILMWICPRAGVCMLAYVFISSNRMCARCACVGLDLIEKPFKLLLHCPSSTVPSGVFLWTNKSYVCTLFLCRTHCTPNNVECIFFPIKHLQIQFLQILWNHHYLHPRLDRPAVFFSAFAGTFLGVRSSSLVYQSDSMKPSAGVSITSPAHIFAERIFASSCMCIRYKQSKGPLVKTLLHGATSQKLHRESLKKWHRRVSISSAYHRQRHVCECYCDAREATYCLLIISCSLPMKRS